MIRSVVLYQWSSKGLFTVFRILSVLRESFFLFAFVDYVSCRRMCKRFFFWDSLKAANDAL